MSTVMSTVWPVNRSRDDSYAPSIVAESSRWISFLLMASDGRPVKALWLSNLGLMDTMYGKLSKEFKVQEELWSNTDAQVR